MVRTCIVIGFALLAGTAIYLGSSHLPPVLHDLLTAKPEHASKPKQAPVAPNGDPPTQKANRGDTIGSPAVKVGLPANAFDVARISHDGPSVFAGHAAPFQTLTLMENGKPVATVRADANGDWVLMTEHRFGRGDPQISLKVGAMLPKAETAVAPSIPQKSDEEQLARADEVSPSPAAEVMRRFERLVSAAREEAKRKEVNYGSPSENAQASIAEKAKRTTSGTEPRPQLHAKAKPHIPMATPVVTEPAAPIPVPVTFIYNEDTLTAEGLRAATLLLEYLNIKNFSTVTLTGHADERGTHEYNLELSRQRLNSIARFLRDGGFKGELELVPKGETTPFAAVDRTLYPSDDLWQLDRRVELYGAQ